MNKALFIMRDYYTGDWGGYNPDDVLSDKFMLSLLLCFDKEDGFSNMLNENIIRTYLQDTKCNRYEKGINRKNIKWEDNIPLKSVFMLFDCSNDWLYDLYQLTVDKDDKIMYLPEGLISIDFDKFDYYHDLHDSMKKFKKQDDKKDKPDPQPKIPQHRRYYGTIELDSLTGSIQFSNIMAEVVSKFTEKPNVKVTLKLDIEAQSDEPFDTALERAVKENATVLGIKGEGFTEES